MDDDNSDWLSASAEDTAPTPEPTPTAAAPTAAAVAAAAAEADAAKRIREIIAEATEAEDPYRFFQNAPKKQLYKHWARPRFLQYDYLYHYMHNYYDDVIDYLDRRMRGYEVEAPKPQTWAERALRTYTRNTYPHSITYNMPVPRQKSYPVERMAPPHRLSYFKSATSTLVSTDTRLITKSRLCLN